MKLVEEILKTQINNKITSNDWEHDGNIADKVSMDFCIKCKREVTYNHEIIFEDAWFLEGKTHGAHVSVTNFSQFQKWNSENYISDGNPIIIAKATCNMEPNKYDHEIYYAYSFIEENTIWKFAEYPFELIKLKNPAPNNELLKKLSLDDLMYKAYKSAQENLWLGALLYSRRVLEGIVNHLKSPENKFDKEWSQKKLGEKIEDIKKQLPDYVKNNIKNLSKILGNALHNHSDQEASQNYNVIIQITQLIINKIEEDQKTKKLEEELSKELTKMVAK